MVQIVGATSNDSVNTPATLVQLAWPVGAAVDDYALVHGNVGAGLAVTMGLSTSGWTLLVGPQALSQSTGQSAVWGKALTSADLAAPPGITASAARDTAGDLIVLRGADFEIVSAIVQSSSVTTADLPSVTPTRADTLLVGFVSGVATVSNSPRAFTAPSGWTEQVDRWTSDTTSVRQGVGVFTKQLTGGAGSPTGTAAYAIDALVHVLSVTLAVRDGRVATGSAAGTGTAILTPAQAATGNGSTASTGAGTVTSRSHGVTAAGSASATGVASIVRGHGVTAAGSMSAAGVGTATLGVQNVTATGSGSASSTATATPQMIVTASGSASATGAATTVATSSVTASGSTSTTGTATTAPSFATTASGSAGSTGTATIAVTHIVIAAGSAGATGAATASIPAPFRDITLRGSASADRWRATQSTGGWSARRGA